MTSKKVIIPALKHGDYKEKEGNQTTTFERGVSLEGVDLTLKAVLTTNPKKGTYSVKTETSYEFYRDASIDTHTFGLLAALQMKAHEAGREWKNNFDENANSQLSLLDQEEEQAPQASQE